MRFMHFCRRTSLCFIVILIFVTYIAPVVFSADEKPVPETLLLKDFRPKSVYNVPQTKIDKARYPAIDMHAHDYAKGTEQIDEWIRAMDAAGIWMRRELKKPSY